MSLRSRPKVSLNAFTDDLRREVDRFKEWWLARHQENPVKYPLEFKTDDWDERYTLYLEMGADKC